MKNKLSLFLSAVLLASTIFAAVPGIGEAPPAVDYASQTQFPPASEQVEETPMVGDDSLPKDNIDRGIFYGSQLGVNTVDKAQDEHGNIRYFDTETGQNIDQFPEHNQTDTYKNAQRLYQAKEKAYTDKKTEYTKALDSSASEEVKASLEAETNTLRAERETALEAAKMAAKQENTTNGNSFKRFEDTMFKGLNPAGTGNSIANKYFMQTKENATEDEINASKLYKSGFGFQQTLSTKDTLNQSNAGKLISAFNYVADMENLVKSKIQSNVIKCYISRQLVPAYYCPFPDMTNTTYPDFSHPNGEETARKVTSAEAEKECNEVCQKERSCVSYKIMDDTNISFPVPQKTMYPTYDANNTAFELGVQSSMQVENINYKITVTPSTTFPGTAEDFEKYLQDMANPIKFKVTVLKRDANESAPPQVILDKEIVQLKSSSILKTLNVFTTGTRLVVQNFKPYIYEKTTEKWKEPSILANIGSIIISEVKGKYTNTDLFFCAQKQLVDTLEECPKGTIIDLDNNSTVYHVCTNVEHKIGPDQATGGFYTPDHCAASCIESKKCKTTYRHYADDVVSNQDLIFKAEVGCVDDPETNQGCTDAICKSFFADGETRPNNEIVIQNDNTRVFTVQNKALTGTVRPKINYSDEIDTVATNYEETFQSEMKDQAYLTMIQNQTFDRIEYPIGTASPRKQAYEKENIGGQTYLNVMLKPNSFHIDNGLTYNVYSILKFDQSYSPAYGIFMIDGQMLDALSQNIQFKDETYMIKLPTGDWKVFKQVNYAKVKKHERTLICRTGSNDTDGNPITTSVDYSGQAYSGANCNVQERVYWNELPSLIVDRNVFYDATSDSFAEYSLTESAPKYVSMQFISDRDFQKFGITDYLERDLDTTPGAMIRSQVEKNNGASFGRIYAGDFSAIQRGWPANVTLYNFYSNENLTYGDIIDNQLVNSNIVWDLANQQSYANKIYDDTEIKRNNIKSFIMGEQDNTTISLETDPSFTEEGQRVFKFMFLVDPTNTDPFTGYQLGGSTVTPTP